MGAGQQRGLWGGADVAVPTQAEMERALLQGEREAEAVRLQQEQEVVQQLQEKLSSLDASIQKERDKVSPEAGLSLWGCAVIFPAVVELTLGGSPRLHLSPGGHVLLSLGSAGPFGDTCSVISVGSPRAFSRTGGASVLVRRGKRWLVAFPLPCLSGTSAASPSPAGGGQRWRWGRAVLGLGGRFGVAGASVLLEVAAPPSSQHFLALARKSLRVPHPARWLPGGLGCSVGYWPKPLPFLGLELFAATAVVPAGGQDAAFRDAFSLAPWGSCRVSSSCGCPARCCLKLVPSPPCLLVPSLATKHCWRPCPPGAALGRGCRSPTCAAQCPWAAGAVWG